MARYGLGFQEALDLPYPAALALLAADPKDGWMDSLDKLRYQPPIFGG